MVEQLVNVSQIGTVLVAGGLVGVAGSVEGWLPLDVVAVLVVGGIVVVIPSYVCVVCVGRIYTLWQLMSQKQQIFYTDVCGCWTCLLQLDWALS